MKKSFACRKIKCNKKKRALKLSFYDGSIIYGVGEKSLAPFLCNKRDKWQALC